MRVFQNTQVRLTTTIASSFKPLKKELILWRTGWEEQFCQEKKPRQRPTKDQLWKDEEFWEIIEKQMLRNESSEDQKLLKNL